MKILKSLVSLKDLFCGEKYACSKESTLYTEPLPYRINCVPSFMTIEKI